MASSLFREIAALETLESAMHGPESLAGALQAIVDSVAHLTGADRATLILIDPTERRIRHFLRGGSGWPEVMTTVGYDELESGLTGWALRTGEVALSPKDPPDPRESEEVQTRRRQTHCGSIVVAPLGPPTERQGTLTLINRPDQRDFTVEDAESLALYAQFTTSTVRLHAAREEAARARADTSAAVRSKMNFLSNLSHELRTPLNGILGFSHLLQTSALDESQTSMVQTIVHSGQRLLATVDNILELAQFEAGQFHLENAPFSPAAALEGVVEAHRAEALAKGLTWTTTLDPATPTIADGDVLRLRQAWNHLLSNAVKFTAQGSISVTLTSLPLESLGWQLVLTVEDTGIGVAGDRQGHWFSPFHQEDGSLTRKFGGTGLGLALCDRIARSMGGGLSLRGVPDQGTIARVWVDLGTEGHPYTARPPGLRVLLQEPDPGNRLVLVKMVEQAGHRIDVVATREQALERLGTDDYEVLLLRTVVGGGAHLDRLRDEANRKGVHLVGTLRAGQGPDADGLWTTFLRLPPDPIELGEALDRCLYRKAP